MLPGRACRKAGLESETHTDSPRTPKAADDDGQETSDQTKLMRHRFWTRTVSTGARVTRLKRHAFQNSTRARSERLSLITHPVREVVYRCAAPVYSIRDAPPGLCGGL